MALRTAAVISVTSFFLGTLMTHWIADSLVLWKSPLTVSHLHTSAIYYSLLATMPGYMQYTLLFLTVFGGISMFTSLCDGNAGNLMFDGASIFLYLISIAVYSTSILPNLAPFVSSELSSIRGLDYFPADLKSHTLEFASSHLVCSVALTGILALQAGRHWVEGDDDDDEDEFTEDDSSQTKEGARGRKGNYNTTVRPEVRDTPSVRRKDSTRKRKAVAFGSSRK